MSFCLVLIAIEMLQSWKQYQCSIKSWADFLDSSKELNYDPYKIAKTVLVHREQAYFTFLFIFLLLNRLTMK